MDYKDIFNMICSILQLVSAILGIVSAVINFRDGRGSNLKHIDADRILAYVFLCALFIVPVAISEVQIIICLIKK